MQSWKWRVEARVHFDCMQEAADFIALKIADESVRGIKSPPAFNTLSSHAKSLWIRTMTALRMPCYARKISLNAERKVLCEARKTIASSQQPLQPKLVLSKSVEQTLKT